MNRKNQNRKYSLNLNTKEDYILISKKILPKVISDVLLAKKLLDEGDMTIQEATRKVGISRTSFYKYCDTVFSFDNAMKEGMIRISLSINDKLGALSQVTNKISKNNYNIITFNQEEPIDGVTDIILSIEPGKNPTSINKMIDEIKKDENVRSIRLLNIEKNERKKN